jgi:hypothetical protein
MKYLGYGQTHEPSVKDSIGRIFCPHQLSELAFWIIVQFLDDNGYYGTIARVADEDIALFFYEGLTTL